MESLERVKETDVENNDCAWMRESTVAEKEGYDDLQEGLLRKLKEEIEVVLVYSTTLRVKMESIYDSLALEGEALIFTDSLK